MKIELQKIKIKDLIQGYKREKMYKNNNTTVITYKKCIKIIHFYTF